MQIKSLLFCGIVWPRKENWSRKSFVHQPIAKGNLSIGVSVAGVAAGFLNENYEMPQEMPAAIILSTDELEHSNRRFFGNTKCGVPLKVCLGASANLGLSAVCFDVRRSSYPLKM